MSNQRFRMITSLVLVIFGLFFLFSACNFTPPSGENQNLVVMTAAAQTVDTNSMQLTMMVQSMLLTAQAQTMGAPAQTQMPMETQPPAVTQMPMATLPPAASELPPAQTEAPATAIPTIAPLPPQLPKIAATVETNCRSGPGPQYPSVSVLNVGQQSVVVGTSADHSWWQIEDPRRPGTKCWVWSNTTQVTGDTSAVPVVEAPPPPVAGAPGFQAEFTSLHPCGAVPAVVFRVYNSGGVPFQSSGIQIRNLATDTVIAGPLTSNFSFMQYPGGCPPGQAVLAPNNSAFVAIGVSTPPPAGTKARSNIVLCTAPNQGGQCVEMKVTFVFP